MKPNEAWDKALDNEGLLNKIVDGYSRRVSGVSDADFEVLKAEGWLALYHAVQKWEPERGRFSTLAWPTITHALDAYVRREIASSGGDRGKGGTNRRYAYVESLDGLAEKLAAQEGTEGGEAYDYIAELGTGDFEEELVDSMDRARVVDLLVTHPGISERDKTFVLRWIHGDSMPSQAKAAGLAPETVRKAIHKALAVLREELND